MALGRGVSCHGGEGEGVCRSPGLIVCKCATITTRPGRFDDPPVRCSPNPSATTALHGCQNRFVCKLLEFEFAFAFSVFQLWLFYFLYDFFELCDFWHFCISFVLARDAYVSDNGRGDDDSWLRLQEQHEDCYTFPLRP